jgi:hypothetical protein
MNIHYPTTDEPATPEFVLAVLQDEYRQNCALGEALNESLVLSFDSTVSTWLSQSDREPWPLWQAFNSEWSINFTKDEWRRVLTQRRKRRLREVCDLIARHATRPRIREYFLLDRPCMPAGAFLTVRSLLADAGADTTEIAPSTPLSPYSRQYFKVFFGPISRLAPGALPATDFQKPWEWVGCFYLFGLMIAIIGVCLNCFGHGYHAALVWNISLVFGAISAGGMAVNCLRLPASVSFGKLQTFRDLAHAIAASPFQSHLLK